MSHAQPHPDCNYQTTGITLLHFADSDQPINSNFLVMLKNTFRCWSSWWSQSTSSRPDVTDSGTIAFPGPFKMRLKENAKKSRKNNRHKTPQNTLRRPNMQKLNRLPLFYIVASNITIATIWFNCNLIRTILVKILLTTSFDMIVLLFVAMVNVVVVI